MDKKPKTWQFYVYELHDSDGKVAYVGKGSGKRLQAQRSNFQLDGIEVARFKSEDHAYGYEKERIKEVQPYLNKCAGGNGSRAIQKVIRTRKTAFEKEFERIGSRAMCARLWLQFARPWNADMSKLEEIRRVAYGQGL